MRTFLSGRSTFGRLVARLDRLDAHRRAGDAARAGRSHRARRRADRREGHGEAEHRLHARRLGQHAVQLPARLRHERRRDDRDLPHASRHRRDGNRRRQRARRRRLREHRRRRAAEYNGYFQITAKPTATTFKYTMSATPAVSPGHGRGRATATSRSSRAPPIAAAATPPRPAPRRRRTSARRVIGLTSVTAARGRPGRRHARPPPPARPRTSST